MQTHADIKSAILPEVASNGVQESAAKAFCPGQSGRTFAGLAASQDSGCASASTRNHEELCGDGTRNPGRCPPTSDWKREDIGRPAHRGVAATEKSGAGRLSMHYAAACKSGC